MSTPSMRVSAFALLFAALAVAPPALAVDAPHNAIQCEDCHSQHAPSYPSLLQQLCQGCHFAGGPATARVSHSSKTTDAAYGNWDTDCWACHDPHTQWQDKTYGTAYGKLLFTKLNAQIKQISPADPGPYYAPTSILRTVSSTNVELTSSAGFVDADATGTDDVCRVCHVSTKATGFASVYTPSSNNHYNYGAASQPGGTCTSCHPHDAGFRTSGCVSCHGGAQPSAGQYRRQVTGAGADFVRASHHVTDGTSTQIVTDKDCVVCHNSDSHRSNPAAGRGVALNDPDSAAAIAYGGAGASAEGFCSHCHDADGASAYGGTKPFGDGRVAADVTYAWTGSSHQSTAKVELANEKCLACHGGADGSDPTATFERNIHGASGPSLLSTKIAGVNATNLEEGVCLACHDGAPATRNIQAELAKTYKHPVATFSGRHAPSEDATSNPGAYAYSATSDKRHAECVDCHNPHAATSSDPLLAVSRIAVTNGAAGSAPMFSFVSEADTATAFREYQVCFKCHSGWTTLRPDTYYAGVPRYQDKSVELNPANESHHAVEAAGKNTSSQMTASLNGGTGLPHLTTSSVLECTDCHNNDQIPTTVSTLGSYTALTKGPHGSNAAAGFSPFLLRAAYRTTIQGAGVTYAQSNFAFCFICHASAPFADSSKNTRTDTAFRLHGFHVRGIPGSGSTGTADPNNPAVKGGAGGNAICKECHYQLHGNKTTYWSGNQSYSRLVNFSPSITGPGSVGAPVWTQSTRRCSLRCHGMNHNPENY